MLGHREPQYSIFCAQGWPHRVPAKSFYARMGAVNDVLFRDDDLAGMYCPDNGRPSLPPSLMSGILLLQFYDEVSDEEAIGRLSFDMRWKVALNLPLDFEPPHASSLSVFRSRLSEHGQERYAFDRLIEVGRGAGLLPESVTALIDTVAQTGAGAVQDTYTMIRKGIRRVLQASGYAVPGKRRGLAAKLAAYLDADRKAAIDWADPAARRAQLKVLAQDAEAVLDLAGQEAADPEVRAAAWLLAKILGDDLTTDEQGNPRIAQGVATDRIISLTDPEMRHGRKSAAQRFDGRKVQVAEEPTSELLLALEPMAANRGDGQDLLKVVGAIQEPHGLAVEQVIADGAYGTGDNRAACAGREIDLVSPLGVPADPEVAKSAFAIDLSANTVTCPQGHTAATCQLAKDDQGRPVHVFTFDRKLCAVCPLFARCVRSQTLGRSIKTHFHEAHLQDARKRQQSDGFRATYSVRAKVERKIAELVRHGMRQSRYIGWSKVLLQAQWTGAAVNLKRLFTLLQGDTGRLRQAMAGLT
jgi:transposase